MSTTPPAIQNLARHLLAGEPARVESANGGLDQAVSACEKLRVPLTNLVGRVGFSSLMSRALTLAKRQCPSLAGLQVEPNGSLAGFDELPRESESAEAVRHGGVLVVAELLGLLVMFIGLPLTLSLVREAWPEMSLEALTRLTEEIP